MTSPDTPFPELIIGNKKISKDNFFSIAEIGHNHQGELKKAFQLISEAARCGVDAVKFQKRDNKSLFTKNFYDSPYDNPNSYGETYGKHREYLEFGTSEYKELIDYSNKLKVLLFATPFDLKSVEFLEKLNLPLYKIASADLKNLPLQREIAKTKKPILLSTGGGTLEDVKRAKNNICEINEKLAILQCTSSYPAETDNLNLKVIKTYMKEFKNHVIGFSDHENGIDAAIVAYILGARIFEKHFTLSRALKGTDHSFSLEPRGLERFIRNLKRIPKMMGSGVKEILSCEEKPILKMAKSIVARTPIKKGEILSENNLTVKSPGSGLSPAVFYKILGKKINRSLGQDEELTESDFE